MLHRKAIAIDPCYIPKSGKKTPGLGNFWSGTANATKRGLEILGMALVDATDRLALFLTAVQTFTGKRKGRTPDYLAHMDDPHSLIGIYLRAFASVADKLRGLNIKNPRKDVFKTTTVKDGNSIVTLYFAKVYAVSLKRTVGAVIVVYDDPEKKTQVRKVYFSTDLTLSGEDIYWVYRARFGSLMPPPWLIEVPLA